MEKNSNHIEVIDVWTGVDSNGIPYKAIKFTNPRVEYYMDAETGKLERMQVYKPLTGTHISKEYMIVDGKRLPIIDPTYYAMKGQKFQGIIVRREVEPYEIVNDKKEIWLLNYIALPVFGDSMSDDLETLIADTFSKRGYTLARTKKYIRQLIGYNLNSSSYETRT